MSPDRPDVAAPRLPWPVLALIIGQLVVAAVVGVLVRGLPTDQHQVGPAALLFLASFVVTEAFVLHLEVGRHAHSVTLTELTLVVGLFFVPVSVLVLVRVLAGVLVLGLIRRQPLLKLAFNVSLWIVEVTVAGAVFHLLGGALHGGLEHLVVPTVVVSLCAILIDNLAVSAVIAASSGSLSLGRALAALQACLIAGLVSTSLAVVCVGALAWNEWLAIPVVCTLAATCAAFRGYGRLQQQHIAMTHLYGFTTELARASGSGAVLHTLLTHIGALMRAERARMLVLSSDGQTVHVYRLSDGRLIEESMPVSEVHPQLVDAIHSSTPMLVPATTRSATMLETLRLLQVRDAAWAPMSGENGLRGLVLVGDRAGDTSTFGGSDGLLLHTLATQAAASLAAGRLLERLDTESRHDPLTGLANRAEFHRLVELAMADAGSGPHAVLLMDLDRFKEVNDTLGHHHGDLLLREIAVRLRACLRPGDVLARLGGDEFALLLHRASTATAVTIGRRVMAALAEPMILQGVAMEVAASCGVVLAPEHGRDAETLLQRADVAMYMAKRDLTGVQVYRAELDESSPRRLLLAGSLRAAIETGQLSLRYQPQVRTGDGRVVAVEALVRWEHPDYGEVSPVDFVGVAEQTGQIRDLTHFVLNRAVDDCARWRRDGEDVGVSVNISVRNLLEPDLPQVVHATLSRAGLDPEALTLEITETHLMADPERTGTVLLALSRLGCRLSVDDFGTGYSSLAYLKSMPVREVKVDKSFVKDLATNADDAAIVKAVIQLGHTLGLEVVAEGVEDAEAAALLDALGCDLLQGWLYARPMTEPALREWLVARVGQPPLAARPLLPLPGIPVVVGRA